MPSSILIYLLIDLSIHLKMTGATGVPRSNSRYSSRASLACMLALVSLAGFRMKMVLTAAPTDGGGYVIIPIPCSHGRTTHQA